MAQPAQKLHITAWVLVLVLECVSAGVVSAQGSSPATASTPDRCGFQWGPALRQSLLFLAIQHTSRFAQAKMRRELGGPFLRDYATSVENISDWGDGDSILTNYFGHPMLGAIAGFIELQNDPHGRMLPFSSSGAYWRNRLRTLAWSAAYSTEFEIGPLSEASVGNVGLHKGTAGYVDLVITPTLGTLALIGEDIVDRYLIEPHEGGPGHRQRLLRTLLNPSRSIANLLRFQKPWRRDTR